MNKKLKITIAIISILYIINYINGKKAVSFIVYNFYHLKPFITSLQGKRVLIVAPHPDDEAISSGGLIQRVEKEGGKIYVLYLTYGDHNEVAFMLDEKRMITTPSLNQKMGQIRRKEAENGMKFIGVPQDHLYFLGFPDNGTLKIWEYYWDNNKPYTVHSLNSNKVPYKNAYKPGAPFTSNAILQEVKDIIKKTHPDIIILPHPYDYNNDHRAAYLFTKLALIELKDLKTPKLYLYLAHHRHWPIPLRYLPYFYLYPPPYIQNLYWRRFELTPEEEINKKRLIYFYRSQFRPKKYYLLSFVRQNELFGEMQDWVLHQGTWINISSRFPLSQKKKDNIKGIQMTIKNNSLILKFTVSRSLFLVKNFSIFIFGTNTEIPFEKMPKVVLEYKFGKKAFIINAHRIVLNDITSTIKGHNLFLSIPLKYLGNPDGFFLGVDEEFMEFSLFHFPWRYIKIENKKIQGYR